MIKIEWNEKKSESNFKKHGFRFDSAALLFEGDYITKRDIRKDYGEPRFLSMGTLGENKRVVVISYTPRSSKLRIISMRKANNREQKVFYSYFSKRR